MDLPDFRSKVVRDRFLEHAPPETVFSFLEKHSGKENWWDESPFSKELLEKLKMRGESLIDLALASFCDDDKILRDLYLEGDDALIVAISSNQNATNRLTGEPGWIEKEEFKGGKSKRCVKEEKAVYPFG